MRLYQSLCLGLSVGWIRAAWLLVSEMISSNIENYQFDCHGNNVSFVNSWCPLMFLLPAILPIIVDHVKTNTATSKSSSENAGVYLHRSCQRRWSEQCVAISHSGFAYLFTIQPCGIRWCYCSDSSALHGFNLADYLNVWTLGVYH